MESQLNSQYTQNGMNIAISIFNFPQDYNLNMRLKSLKYLFSFYKRVRRPGKKELVHHSIIFLKNLLQTSTQGYAVAELADILYVHAPETQHEVNNLILAKERERRFALEEKKIVRKKTVYEDKQNVHNSTINKSVLEAAKRLIEKYKISSLPLEEKNILFDSVSEVVQGKDKKLIKSLEYIRGSSGTFGENITLIDTFLGVWYFIQERRSDSSGMEHHELLKRLKEELQDMNGLCSTGHIARLVNVLQGHTEDFVIKISEKDRYTSIVNNYLTMELRNCYDEKVLDGMTVCSPEFLAFIKEKIEKKSEVWKKEESKEFFTFLPDLVNKFIGNNK